jgi:hypothetical protein
MLHFRPNQIYKTSWVTMACNRLSDWAVPVAHRHKSDEGHTVRPVALWQEGNQGIRFSPKGVMKLSWGEAIDMARS